MRLARLALAVVAFGCNHRAPTPDTDAGRVLEQIRRNGPDSVAARMDRDDVFGDRVLRGISSGDSTWLEVAVALRPTGVADVAESLPMSVAEALPREPVRVLRLIDRKEFSVDAVCTIPFIEPSDSLVAAYHREASAALGNVDQLDLAPARERCRSALDRARKAAPPGV